MENYGWQMLNEGNLGIKWESLQNIGSADRHVKYYLKGCGCKTSNCATKQCGCKKQDPPRTCGPGCTCSPEFCRNQQEAQTQCPPMNPDVMSEELEDESDEEAEYSFELEEVENENHIDMHTQELQSNMSDGVVLKLICDK